MPASPRALVIPFAEGISAAWTWLVLTAPGWSRPPEFQSTIPGIDVGSVIPTM